VVDSGRQLKGIEAVGARYLTKIMMKMKKVNRKAGFKCETYLQGHCDWCQRKCPIRENPPCKRGGMPSLESIGINVYSLLDQLGVQYEYPVMKYLTIATLMLVGKK
jgi:predicted metal-binding protein